MDAARRWAGRPVLIDPVPERVAGDVDVGGKPCGQAETVRGVQVEPDVSVAAGSRDPAAPVGFAEDLCEDHGVRQPDPPFRRPAARGGRDGGAAPVPALGEMPVREQEHAQQLVVDYVSGL